MTKTAIDSHEEQSTSELSEEDPGLRLSTTSSPSWDMILAQPLQWGSISDFGREEVTRNLSWARERLRHCLSGTLDTDRLHAAVCQLRALRQSRYAWQDIHSEDAHLLQLADSILEQQGAARR